MKAPLIPQPTSLPSPQPPESAELFSVHLSVHQHILGIRSKGMRVTCNIAVLGLCLMFLVWTVSSHPVSSPEIATSIKNISSHHNIKDEREMRNIPQWHCLRYRRFALVRRCRNYRRH